MVTIAEAVDNAALTTAAQNVALIDKAGEILPDSSDAMKSVMSLTRDSSILQSKEGLVGRINSNAAQRARAGSGA